MVVMDMDVVDTKANTKTKTNTKCFKDPMYAIFVKISGIKDFKYDMEMDMSDMKDMDMDMVDLYMVDPEDMDMVDMDMDMVDIDMLDMDMDMLDMDMDMVDMVGVNIKISRPRPL